MLQFASDHRRLGGELSRSQRRRLSGQALFWDGEHRHRLFTAVQWAAGSQRVYNQPLDGGGEHRAAGPKPLVSGLRQLRQCHQYYVSHRGPGELSVARDIDALLRGWHAHAGEPGSEYAHVIRRNELQDLAIQLGAAAVRWHPYQHRDRSQRERYRTCDESGRGQMRVLRDRDTLLPGIAYQWHAA